MAKHTLKVPKAKEFDQMSSDELREMLSQLKLRKMAIDGSNKSPIAHPIDHPSGEARQNRKSIARIMTILVKRGEKCVR
jgi:ribosomal protein L29